MTYPGQGPQQGYAGQPAQPPVQQQSPLQQGYPAPGAPAAQPTQYLPPQQPAAKGRPAALVLGLLSVALVIVGISVKEDGSNAWHSVHAWGAVAIAGAVLTLAPAAGRSVGLGAQRAFQVAVAGAAALVLYWVLFVLPSVGSNTSLLTTLGVAAGVLAVWMAPARPEAGPGAPQAW